VPTIIEPFTELHSKGRLQALPANISFEWKGQIKTNALAYCDEELITAIKKFYCTGPEKKNL
jgi:hypothetical protein